MTTTRAIPELSIDTQTIERLLWDVQVGQELSYRVLSDAIGRNVQTTARHILQSAIRRVLREKRIVFAAVRGRGLKRLDDAGVVSTGEEAVASIGRKSRRAVKKLACADYDALAKSDKVKHNVIVSQLGVLAHMTSGTTQKKLESRMGNETKALPLAKMLDEMRGTL